MDRSRDRGGYQGRGDYQGGRGDGRGDGRGFRGRGDNRGGADRGGYQGGGGGNFPAGPKIYEGRVGQPTNLLSNHFKVTLRNMSGKIFIYKLGFTPEPQYGFEKSSLIKNASTALNQIYGINFSYSNDLFALSQVNEEQYIVSQLRGVQHEITIRLDGSFSLNENLEDQKQHAGKILNFVNVAFKKTLYEHKFKQVGRLPRFFLASELVPIEKYRLQMWPGYMMQAKSLNDGMFVNIDCATKFVEMDSVYDYILDLQKDRYSQDDIRAELVPKDPNEKRMVVITMYNSKIYQLDDVRFDITPKNHIFEYDLIDPLTREKTKQKTNMIQYMRNKYGITINARDENQPTLVVHEKDHSIYLVPSLCFRASLDKNFTSDSRKMKDLQEYKLSHPEQRFTRINSLAAKFQAGQLLDSWGLKMNANFAQAKAKQLPNAKIVDDRKQEQDWSAYETRRVKHLQPCYLKSETWALVYANRDFDNANTLVEMMKRASGGFGIRIEDPQYVEVQRNDRADEYIKGITSDIDPKYTTLVVVVLGKRQDKPKVKAQLDSMGIPSQFILSETVFKKSRALGVFSNLIKQMNAKLRQDLYNIALPCFKKTMIIGTDIVNTGGNTILGLSASQNSTISQYFTKIETHPLPKRETSTTERLSKDQKEQIVTEKRCQILCQFVCDALKGYSQVNKGPLPDQIVIYRDGIGGPTLQTKCQAYEVPRVIEAIQSQTAGYNPAIIYCFVDRNVTHRLFGKPNGEVMNPSPGTVLDVALVENQGDNTYDFFMIPHKATVATAQPVHYKVIYNSSNLNKDQFELTTYHLCYNYVNFCGSIKVPSACMYAKKIADYSAENKCKPNDRLSSYLHFL